MSNPEPLQHGRYYHIFNRGVNGQPIFYEERNYHYFLRLYAKHVMPTVDTYAYGLLNNHFHLALRVKTVEELTGVDDTSGLVLTPRKPSQYFSNWFNAYSRGINKAYGRTGALFESPFGRRIIESRGDLLHLIAYIHQNPQKHGFVQNFWEWKYSSYWACVSEELTNVNREQVLAWYGDREAFKEAHRRMLIDPALEALDPDDFISAC